MKLFIVFILLFSTVNVFAKTDEERFHTLTAELRCLVCQNQSLFDSDAPLAKQLKQQIQQQIAAGKTDEEIIQYLTTRFGDFILYNPPVNSNTWALWFMPLLFLGVAMIIFIRIVKNAKKGNRHAQ